MNLNGKRKAKRRVSRDTNLPSTSFALAGGMENTDPVSEVKGIVLVDKKNRSTSIYLDTNENGKLNKRKDLLIASDDGFKQMLYKKIKKGDLFAANSEELMRVAVSDLFCCLPDTFEFIYDTGMIFSG